MGSAGWSLSINLDGSIMNAPDMPIGAFMETALAITQFVYTGDDEVNLVRYSRLSSDNRRRDDVLPSSCTRRYQVSRLATPTQIASSGRDVTFEDKMIHDTAYDPSAPAFAQYVRRIGLLVVQDGDNSQAEFDHHMGGTDTGLNPLLLCISQRAGVVTGRLIPGTSKHHADIWADVLDTIERVILVIGMQWESPLNQLDFLGPANWSQITEAAQGIWEIGDNTLCDILDQQSRIRPDKIAVEAWDGNLTYGELHGLSRHMATLLIKKGAIQEDRIGFCMKKSKWAMVTVWAILMAGCTVVPLDIRNPLKRTRELVARTAARYVVADQWTAPGLKSVGATIINCQTDTLDTIEGNETGLDIVWPQVTTRSVAYILFTSGSTGIPKGVVLEHGPLYASVVEFAAEYEMSENSTTFQFAPFVFDASTGEIFTTMLQGGCLFVPSEEERLDNLSGTLRRSRATHIGLPSSIMAQVQTDDATHLEYLIAVGEILSRANFLKWSPRVNVVSGYGITETIIFDSFARSQHLSSDHRNIGLANGRLWITDEDDPGKLMPIGAIGEILIEGPMLARGYLDDPKRTAERFILAPPWLQTLRGGVENHRCYRSGDYGIRNADGTVLYMGRMDFQVKIGGQRIELGEVEHNLLGMQPALGQVAVEAVQLEHRGNTQAVVAFVSQTSIDSKDPSAMLPMDDDLKIIFQTAQSKLLEILPRHMVPRLFIPIRHIPKSAVGKRDRKCLRSWGTSLTEEQLAQYQLQDSSMYQSPDTPEERLLHELWARVLRAPSDSLSLNDNFFQVGGDSIKAIELVAELRKQRRGLTVSHIFQNPVMGEMAELLSLVREDGPGDVSRPFDLIPVSLTKDIAVQEVVQVCQVNFEQIEDIYPAAPMQEALMAISASRPTSFYKHRLVFIMPESIDVDRFKEAWEMLISAQPILRTRIVAMASTGTMQVVVRAHVEWQSDKSLNELLRWDDETPFTYGSALSRYAIVRDETHRWNFIWSGHHAITDGWSRPAMFDAVRHIYNHGSVPQQTPYTPFVKYISQLNLEESDEFWRSQFPDIVESFPRLCSPDFIPHAQHMQALAITLGRPATCKTTPATLVQAAWSLVTAAYANTNEAVFGLTLSGRDAPVPDITKMMGITITTVPVRVAFDSTSTIVEYLEEVQSYISEVKQHQHVGLQRISHLSPEARSATGFQNLLVIQPADEDEDHEGLADLGLQLIQREEKDKEDHALTIQCTLNKNGGSLKVKAFYDDRVVTAEEVDCLLHLFEHIVKQLATESTSHSLHDFDRLSPHDLNILAKYNSQAPPAIEQTLHSLFEERARETPMGIALDGFGGTMTYSELDLVSSKLASHLRRHTAVTVESRVLLCFRKSQLPIIAMLAILKCGGVCVSTDPGHPTARLLEISKDVESKIVLCDESNVEIFGGGDVPVIGLTDALLGKLVSESAFIESDYPHPKVQPSNASFIVYTSGSTGKPKGSVLEHRSLVTEFIALGQRAGLSARSRTLQFSAYTFDVHIVEIFGTLIHGGCVCVISDYERMNRLEDVINERRVNFAVLTKTVSRLLEPHNVPTLEALILTGEANGRQDYWRWAERLRLFNGLGPSECTPLVCLTRNPVGPETDPANIGNALACRLWVTVHRRPDRLVPIGCVGELIVEGPIVGRGYVNRPRETASAFIHDPAWARNENGSGAPRRFYRSGDLAKMNADGSITFIGRADDQVKVHGQRIELGEVEDQLRRCSTIFTSSAVDALNISSRGGATVLAVFCRRNGGEGDSPILPMDDDTLVAFSEAQAEVSKVLPRYMVPSVFLPVRELPFNASGKLERKKLRSWVADLDAADLGQYYLTGQISSRAVETENEKLLAALWAKVLCIPLNIIHAEGNFFRLGGDSVLSIKLISEARAVGIFMTVADVFRAPSLDEMALTLVESGQRKGERDQMNSPIKPVSLIKDKVDPRACIEDAAQSCDVTPDMIEDIYPCNPTQEALMAVSSHRQNAYTYQIVLKLPPSMGLDRFKSAWEKLVAAQAIYRTRIVFRRGLGSLQVVLRAESNIKWHTVTGTSLEEYLRTDGNLLVEYGSELCKFALLQNGDETTFVGTIHHALYDGWSLMLTYEEFNSIYKTGSVQKPVIPYARLFRHLSAIDEGPMDEFWKTQFQSVIESYPWLPSAGYNPQPRQSATSTFALTRNIESDFTLATVIQATWGILMSKYSDSEAVVYGLTLSGRDTPVDGIEDVIGTTISTVPVRVDLEPDMSLRHILDCMQKKTTAIKKYQHAGLQRIRRLSPAASVAAGFQNLLVIQTMGDAEITTPLTELGLQTIKSGAEEFLDIALSVEFTIRPDTLQVLVNYDNAVVPDRQVDFMLHQMEHIASTLVNEANMTRQLRDIHLASPYDMAHIKASNSQAALRMRESLLPSLETDDVDKSSIGRIWIVESSNDERLVPVGCVGRLWIEGATLAEAYIKGSNVNAALAMQAPAWSCSGQAPFHQEALAFYRTNELAYLSHDGSVKLLGLPDTQVKVYGQRVNTDEVEQQIRRQLPPCSEVVVDVVDFGKSTATLSAFIKLPTFVRCAEDDLSVNDKNQLLSFQTIVKGIEPSLPANLPQHEIPSAFVPVAFIPASPANEVDKVRLRDFAAALPEDALFPMKSTAVKGQLIKNTVEAKLQLVWSQILNHKLSEIRVNDTFMALGGDSITAMQVVSECRKMGIRLRVSTVLQKKTIAAIAPYCKVQSTTQPIVMSTATDGIEFNLSPAQALYFEQESQNPTSFNQGFLCRIKNGVPVAEIRRAFDIVVRHHAMLRARFRRAEEDHGKWVQYTAPATSESWRFKSHSLSPIEEAGQENIAACIVACTRDSISDLDLTGGPVFAVDFFDVAGDDNMIYMVAHHLVIDLVSWRIIWHDLDDIVKNRDLMHNSARPVTFQNWLSLQEKSVNRSSKSSAELTYPIPIPANGFDFWGVSQEENTLANGEVGHSFSLSPEITRLLIGEGNQALGTAPLDILIGLLMLSFRQTFGDREIPTMFIEHHGREPCDGFDEIDLSHTVGWFTTMYPVHIPMTTSTAPNEAIRLAKDIRSLVPRNGQPYFAHRHLSPQGSQFAHHTPAEILVNFAGLFQQLESSDSLVQQESRVKVSIQESDAVSHRYAMMDVEAGISGGVMEFSLNINKKISHKQRVKEWITLFQDLLTEHLPSLATEEPTYTLSDFPRLDLSYDDLQYLVYTQLPQFEYGAIQDICPCTAMQEGVLLSQQTDSQVYKLEHIWEFTDDPRLSELDPSRLAQAWKSIVQRHSTLRTGIVEHVSDQGHFIQVVLKDLPSTRFVEAKEVINDISDIGSLPDAEEHDFWAHVPELTLYITSNGRSACRLKLSHVLMDGMSLDIFMNEFVSLLTGETLEPSTLASDFGRYVKYEENVKSDDSLTYWAEYLNDAKPCHVPTNKMAGKASNARQDYALIKLPDDTADGLISLSQRLGITPAAILQTSWAIVLGAFTGQEDVCFGYLASGRDAELEGIEQSIGLLISIQVCRVRLEGAVKDRMQDVQNAIVTGLEHRNVSLAVIQSMLGLKSSLLFNSCMSIRRALGTTARANMDSLIKVSEGVERTEFVIALDAAIGSAGAKLGMTYQKGKISQAYARSIAGSLETVVRSLLKAEASQRVCEIELIGRLDLEVLEQWNSPPLEMLDATLHGLFEEQVRENPGAIATSGFDGEYTYCQLNAMADQLAALLATYGVSHEIRVVLCFPKSTWPIISMLAVLKAGGACVSTNPEHPTARVLDICDDVETKIVLCDESNAARFHGHVTHVIPVNQSLFSPLEAPSSDWVRPLVLPTNAAFVVYTSGSTGKPKGCVLEHHSVSKSQLVNAQAMNIRRNSRAIQFSAYTFDASICEIFAPLVTGACVCVISDDERMDDLAMAINVRAADWIMLTPTVAELFTPSEVPSLKTLVFGGEPLSRKALEIWSDHAHIVNYWGPSECSNSGCINIDITLDSDPMNIGRPSGHRLWITEQGNPHRLAPLGCVGEMVVEGPLVSRGYLNRLDATAAAFVTDLVWSNDGTGRSRRFYKTGDLGRFNPDGTVTISGRADNQVKINGQRVELGEIKHQIAANLPRGSEVVVDVLSLGGNSKSSSLAAFIKLEHFPSGGNTFSELEVKDAEMKRRFRAVVMQLEQALASCLPPYMIPHSYIPISKIPLTPSAKTDKKLIREFARSLAADAIFKQEASWDKKQPTNDMELDLQTVWSKVLNHPNSEIGIDDTFMSLGGDSISAMRAVAQCRKAGIRVPISVVLQKNTIAAIAPCCERTSGRSKSQLGAAKATDGILFHLSPMQKRYFDMQSSNSRIQYNQSNLLRIKQGVCADQVKSAMDLIVNRHGMLRARFTQDSIDGTWQQLNLPPGKDKNLYRFISHRAESVGEEIIRLSQTSGQALNIVNGPIFSVDFFGIPNEDGVLFLTAHHLVVDIVSWQVILSELEEILQNGGSEITLNLPDITFQQWRDIQERESRTQASAEEVFPIIVPLADFEYWHVPAHENIVQDAIEESFDLSTTTTNLILSESNQALRTTPLDVLLGPLLSSFRSVFPDREAPSAFIEHHGRELHGDGDSDPSQLVGWFTTVYPVHISTDSVTDAVNPNNGKAESSMEFVTHSDAGPNPSIGAQDSAIEAIRLIKDLRQKIPQNGRPYFSYRYFAADGAERFSHHDLVELQVNFAGAFQHLDSNNTMIQFEDRLDGNAIPDASSESRRWAMIDVQMEVKKRVISVHFTLNRRMVHLERVQQWIKDYKSLLSDTAAQLARQPPAYTLGDFPLLDISYARLTRLFSETLPRLGHDSADGIEDILPLSPYQKFAIEGHRATPPRHWCYFYFDLSQNVDTVKLRQACVEIVKQYSILRTLFVDHCGGLLQLVMRSLEPQIDFYESDDDDIKAFMKHILSADLAKLPILGKPFLRFFIIRTRNSARLAMRLSHAQFDAFSRLPFVDSLAALYERQTSAPLESIGFAQLVRHNKRSYRESYKFWNDILVGAIPTRVLPIIPLSSDGDERVLRIEKMVAPFRTLPDVTSATLFNAACAILLHKLTKSSDITFGRITSGRTGLGAEFQAMVGPCLNIVPVRVKFHDKTETTTNAPLDILQQIHKQYAESIPYETMGLDDIIRECTDWKTSMAEFPVITQHVNLDQGSEAHVTNGTTSFKINEWDPVNVDPFPWSLGLGAFPGPSGVRISIAANSKFAKPGLVELVMEELCKIIDSISKTEHI